MTSCFDKFIITTVKYDRTEDCVTVLYLTCFLIFSRLSPQASITVCLNCYLIFFGFSPLSFHNMYISLLLRSRQNHQHHGDPHHCLNSPKPGQRRSGSLNLGLLKRKKGHHVAQKSNLTFYLKSGSLRPLEALYSI